MTAPLHWKLKNFTELTAQEVYAILQVRAEVFVVEQNCPYLDADGNDDQALHLWAEQNGEIIAYCRLFGPGIKYKEPSIGRVLTKESARGTGAGKILMKLALEAIHTHFGTTECRISAQDYLLRFYEGFGFIATDHRYLEDDIPHTEMHRRQ